MIEIFKKQKTIFTTILSPELYERIKLAGLRPVDWFQLDESERSTPNVFAVFDSEDLERFREILEQAGCKYVIRETINSGG